MCAHKHIQSIRQTAATRSRIDYLPNDPEQRNRLRKLLAPLRWDVMLGAIVLWVVTVTFMMAGAAVLYPMLANEQINEVFKGWSLLTDQAHVWKHIHPYLGWVYYVTVIAALWGTLQPLPEVYTRVTQEFCQAIWPHGQWRFRVVQAVICAYLFVLTTAMVWQSLFSFRDLIQIVAFVVTNLAVAIMMFAALYLNYKLPRSYRTRRPMLVGAVASAVVLAIATGISGWSLALKWWEHLT